MRLLLTLLWLVLPLAAADPVVSNGLPPPHDVPIRRFGDDRFRVPGYTVASATTRDGKRLAVLSTSAQRSAAVVTIFDTESQRPLVVSRVQYAGFGVFSLPGMAFSHDGGYLALVLNRETTYAIATDTGREVWRAKDDKNGGHTFCAFDPAGRLIRTFETETKVHDIPSGNVVATWPVGGLAQLTPDAKTYVRTRKVYTEVEIGDTATGRPRHILPLRTAQNGIENGYAVSHDGRTLAVFHAVSEIHLIDLATGATRRKWELERGTLPVKIDEFALAFAPDDRTLMFSTLGRLRRWQLDPFQELPPLQMNKSEVVKMWHSTHDGKTILIPRNGLVERWSATTAERIPEEQPGGGGLFGFTPDGRQLVASDRVGRIGVWDTATGEFVRSLDLTPMKTAPLLALAVAPDGRYLAFSRYEGDFEIAPLNRDATAATTPMSMDRAGSVCLAWSPDSKHVYGFETSVLEKRRRFVQYRVDDKQVVKHLSLVNPLTLTPNGREVVHLTFQSKQNGIRETYSAHLTRHDIATDTAVGEVAFQQPSLAYGLMLAAYSPDGSTLALAAQNKVHVQGTSYPPFVATDAPPLDPYAWKFGNPQPLRVTSLAFTPNGHWLVTGGDDCAVKVWEAATGKLVKRIDGHDQPVVQVAVAGDGRSVFSSGADGFVYQWSLTAPYHKLPPTADELFAMLSGPDPAVAVPAAWKMMGDETLRKFVVAKEPPSAKPDADKVAKAIADLDAPAFAARTAATKELASLGRSIETDLRESLLKTASVETRERIEGLIARFEKKYSPDELRALRLVEACEWHRLKEPLTTWATGATSALLTREAKAALTRMK